jgi:glutamate-1-semialdehyde 2,1-aminomutase
MNLNKQSYTLFAQAQQYFPGGVNSPVRSFSQVDSQPIFIKAAQGAYLIDEDDNNYIDYVGSWGPMIVGHAHPQVLQAINAAAMQGTSFGAASALEIDLATMICQLMPNINMLRFVNSGTEAAMSAIRLARGYTKRNKIIKFAGCYHGHSDSLLVAAGSGGLTLSIPNSAGVLADLAQHTLVAVYNRIDSVKQLFSTYGNDIAAIIVEPVAGNMNCVLPQDGFLQQLKELCLQHGSLLILDEVMTGFRVGLGGAQEYYQVQPDLTILGKIIGGGLPVGAFGGKAEIMRLLAPIGPVYQAGTLSGNPLAMAAGLATLKLLSTANFYYNLTSKCLYLADNLTILAKKHHIPLQIVTSGAMFGIHFNHLSVIATEDDVKQGNLSQFKTFFQGMLQEGIYLAPSYFECGFISSAHEQQDLDQTLAAAAKVFAKL